VSSSVEISLPQILEELIIKINYSILNDPKLDPKIGKEIISQIDKSQQRKCFLFFMSHIPIY